MKVLLLDDNPYDREMIKHRVQSTWPDTTWLEVSSWASFDEALQQEGDCNLVLTDYQLKWTTGLDVLHHIHESYKHLPVIMVIDTGSEEIAVEAMKMGLYDYVLKTQLSRLPLAIRKCLEKQKLLKEHASMERQMQEAQKMESLGLLVSGLAHDFNNLLAGIMGYAQQGLKHEEEPEIYFQHIYERAEQGARMTRQLLAFARGNRIEPSMIELNELIKNLLPFVGTLLGPSIILEFTPDPQVQMLYVDPTQLEQILVNLCVNARDAMPRGGTLRIATELIMLEEGRRSMVFEAQPGEYVRICVSDTGTGMPPEAQARLFEPFFTTKEVGQGTGLGLSVVYGLIRQHQGFVEVASILDQGTTFDLYFPLYVENMSQLIPEEAETVKEPVEQAYCDQQFTVLLVEDDPDIQFIIEETLRDEGYCVLVASDGEEGLKTFQAHAERIQLVIADIMMPKMQGKAFQEQVRQSHPHVKILVMSGYQRVQLQQQNLLDPHSSFLQKPFDLDIFCETVQKLLASPQ